MGCSRGEQTLVSTKVPTPEWKAPKHTYSKPVNSPCVLITGASGGLGRELAHSYTNHGFSCLLHGRAKHRLARTAEYISSASSGHQLLYGDLRHSGVRDQIVSVSDICSVKQAVLCAASHGRTKFKSCTADDITGFTEELHANVDLIHRLLRLQSLDTIVYINSIAGKSISPDEPLYAMMKHGMAGLLKSIRLDLRKQVRLIDVFIGAIRTPITEHRDDYANLIDPIDAADCIVYTAMRHWKTLAVEELHIGRFQ